MGRVRWERTELIDNLRAGEDRVESAMFALTEKWRPAVEGFARSNAPWTDRTGNARQGLTARTEHSKGSHAIDLFHRMPYGIYLETRWNGRYEIIMPTVRTVGKQIMVDARSVMRALGRR